MSNNDFFFNTAGKYPDSLPINIVMLVSLGYVMPLTIS